MRKQWTDAENIQLEKLVESGNHSFKNINLILGRQGARDQSRRLGFKNKFIRRKYTFNESFWSIPNKNNCYWAGFSAADASIHKRRENSYTYCISIHKQDEAHLQRFANEIDFTGKIEDRPRPDRNTHLVTLRINNKKWAMDLNNNFGIFPRKTQHIMPPNIQDNELLLRWLVGYTDGDGSVYGKDNKLYLSYVSCNPKLMEWIQTFFLGFGTQLKQKFPKITNVNGRYFKFAVGGLKAAQFIDYVNSLDIYCLTRKWQNSNILGIVNQFKQKYPQHFLENRVKSP